MWKWCVCALIGLLSSGCERWLDGLYAPIPPYIAPDMSASMPDQGVDACVPMVECAANQCGVIDDGCGGDFDCGGPTTCTELGDVCGVQADGCGGELDCGVCACDGDTPTSPSCGLCGLGRSTCSQERFVCQEPPWTETLSGLDCAQIIYASVDAAVGGDGSEMSPLSSLERAVNLGPVVVILGSGVFEESVLVPSGVSVVGGFNPQDGLYDTSFRPTVKVPPLPGDVFGVRVEETGGVLLSGFSIETQSATNGGTNYGLHLHNSNEVLLHRLEVRAGQGGDGAPGREGSNGVNGANGEDGGKGHYNCNVISLSLTRLRGAGGTNIGCANSNGGVGGLGAYECYEQNGNGGRFPSEAGGDAPGDANVGGGRGGILSTTASQRAGGDGDTAMMDAMTRARNGSPGMAADFVVDAGLWISQGHGEDGVQGKDGLGGAGGGGASELEEEAPRPTASGPSGGGGGAGGCGGSRGTGGGAGGASFGLFLSKSQGVRVLECTFEASSGGQGGAGGNGGQGGSAGRGGRGSDRVDLIYQRINGQTGQPETVNEVFTMPYSAGDGGDGARGQGGGHGGGGAGGSSYGVYCQESSLSERQATMFKAGAASQGGASSGAPGTPGLVEDVVGCDP